jgi:hypothetical protein
LGAEIAYNVEHVFNENGREVRKMPIKMGDETIWVDCVDQTSGAFTEQQVFFKKKRLPGVGSEPESSQFHLFSHFSPLNR